MATPHYWAEEIKVPDIQFLAYSRGTSVQGALALGKFDCSNRRVRSEVRRSSSLSWESGKIFEGPSGHGLGFAGINGEDEWILCWPKGVRWT